MAGSQFFLLFLTPWQPYNWKLSMGFSFWPPWNVDFLQSSQFYAWNSLWFRLSDPTPNGEIFCLELQKKKKLSHLLLNERMCPLLSEGAWFHGVQMRGFLDVSDEDKSHFVSLFSLEKKKKDFHPFIGVKYWKMSCLHLKYQGGFVWTPMRLGVFWRQGMYFQLKVNDSILKIEETGIGRNTKIYQKQPSMSI